MRTNKGSWFSSILNCEYSIILLVTCSAVNFGFSPTISEGGQVDAKVTGFAAYQQALEARNDAKAIPTGDSIFTQIEKKYKSNAGFRAYKSKLDSGILSKTDAATA
jgi:hypothetical protein